MDGNFTFSNFGAFFTDKMVLKNLGNSVLIGLCTTVFCLLFSYPVALVLANSRFNKTMILVLLFILPMYINSLLRTTALRAVFEWMRFQNMFFRTVIAHVFDFIPFMLLPIYTVLVNMDKSYLEAANDLGAGSVRTFFKVTLPLSVPGIVSGILMVFMPTVSMYAIHYVIARNEEWKMFGQNIQDLFLRSMDYGKGAAYSFILLIMVMVSIAIAGLINRRRKGGALDA
jgi:spermidine/putrescine transport system permease protein